MQMKPHRYDDQGLDHAPRLCHERSSLSALLPRCLAFEPASEALDSITGVSMHEHERLGGPVRKVSPAAP